MLNGARHRFGLFRRGPSQRSRHSRGQVCRPVRRLLHSQPCFAGTPLPCEQPGDRLPEADHGRRGHRAARVPTDRPRCEASDRHSSSDAEHDAALARTQELVVFLREQAWPEPVAIADSGNGGHADYAIDLPNDVESRDLVKRVLEALDLRFSDSVVQVDLTTFNSARIWKLYGTPAIKGDNTFERPHRMSRIIASAPREPVSRALLEKLAATVPQVDAGARVRGRFDCKPG